MKTAAAVPFSNEYLRKLKAGERFETDSVFPGVTAEPLKWLVVRKDDRSALLRATFYGIAFGDFEVHMGSKKAPKVKPL